MSVRDDFDLLSQLSLEDKEMADSIRNVGATVLAVNPAQESIEALRELASKNTLLLIGGKETVTNATLAFERAIEARIETKVYPNGGHLMLVEDPRDQIEEDVVSFLTRDLLLQQEDVVT